MIADNDQAENPGAGVDTSPASSSPPASGLTADVVTTAAAAVPAAESVSGVIHNETGSASAVDPILSAGPVSKAQPESSRAALTNDKQSSEGVIADEELMLDYAGGNAEAFNQLYTKYRPALFRFFVAALGDDSLANELYQETWAKVIGASRNYQPTAKFSTWLFTIARNSLWDYFRKFQPHLVEFDTITELGTEESNISSENNMFVEMQPEEVAALGQQSRILQLSLDRLSLNQKEVMLLRYVAGMSIAEIADSVEEKPETVKSRLRYATAKLKQSVKQSLK